MSRAASRANRRGGPGRRVVRGTVAVAALALLAGCNSGDDSGDGPTARNATPAETAAEFLTAWENGDVEQAASLTDDPGAARTALASFASDTRLSDLTLTPGTSSGGAISFLVTARLPTGPGDEDGQDGQGDQNLVDWQYRSELSVRQDDDLGTVVAWEPTVLHPRLTDGNRLETGPLSDDAAVRVLDRDGDELTAEAHPSLAAMLTELGSRYGAEADTGSELRLVDSAGARVEQLLELAGSNPVEVPTTIDSDLQAAAEEVLAGTDRAGLAAIRPSTGEILALVTTPAPDPAEDPEESTDLAVKGRLAPGSTWKIVSSALMIDRGLASPSAAHPCPKNFDHGGWPFENLNEFELENGTFTQSFAASCNTAFVSAAPDLSDEELGAYARNTFGIGLEWDAGIAVETGTVPVESNAQMAAQLIGQAGVRANPLVMASVSATVRDGSFRQPYLVPPDHDGRELATAAGPSEGTAAQLRGLMVATAQYGTAAAAMSGVAGDAGAKTGSAEVIGQEDPNAWFTAYRDDLAVAAVVPESGHGGKIAGPLVAKVLNSAP
ncbi:penicillin-binding transpeptidase domain-containing protein [Streptomyces sp. ST2-7A]|uniref:penicillin-binding transpeptidase domain-containing protein n=1 Tax=Streptomyces sp. ST2-7A TaxID=2907214 RepID=UPI001F2103D5|nr:penicillin-binding transpeptidase domain-containing protein [Streptomyces sp. ST2-7A]MCE7081366.1 penicillin-binding protein [Streptomyces sp. ST2-7A]